jgi:hypothetical protein
MYAALLVLAVGYAALLAAGMGLGTDPFANGALSLIVSSVQYSVTHIPYLLALGIVHKYPVDGTVRRIAIIGAVVIRILAFAGPSLLSDDLNRYRWEAKVLDLGGNPYRVTPRELPLGEQWVPVPESAAVYGPVLEAVNWLAWRLTGEVKVAGAFGEALLLALLYWYVERRGLPFWRWMVLAWSPLQVYEFWRQGHNDSWMVLLLFGAVMLAEEGRRHWSWVLLVGAGLTKWWPLMLLPLWLVKGFSLPGVGALLGGALCCLGLLPWGELWLKLRFVSGFLGGWQNNALFYRFLSNKLQAMALIGGTALGLPFLRWSWTESVLCFVTVLLALSANIHPWYLGWVLPFVAASRWNVLPWLLWAALMPLCYDPMIGWRLNGVWREDAWIRTVILWIVPAFSVFCILRRRNR